ncbi:MAG: putative peptidoglycan lipid flippase [Solirubrobacteraceae bacterium]|nr:putative peptidoglycan lipid flippase [Solirubrobacteraceae bacterium]
MASETRPAGGSRIARNTAIFSVATGLSRVAGLVREVVASSYFGTSGAFSAFTVAFQVPNLVRSLFADSALSAAFVPVFTDLLEKGNKRDAFRLASTLAVVIVGGLGSITALFIIAAPWLMPLLTDTAGLDDLATGLSQVLFPIVLLLGLNGLVVGILNAYDHFTVPAIAPLVWNVVIIVVLVATRSMFEGDEEMYAYAIGVVAGTVVQFVMVLPVLRRLDFKFSRSIDLRDPRLRQVLMLMLPVTVGLGLINFGQVIDSTIGFTVSESAPRAIDAAFRVYMLPQGMFSVAVATVLFPALSRLVSRGDFDGLRSMLATGTRGVFLLLIPCAALTLVLAEPITRLVYERGAFGNSSTDEVSTALLWFSFSLPFSGVNLLLTRTFFSLQRPWLVTKLSGITLVINVAVSVALAGPLGIAGIVIGTVVSTFAMTVMQAYVLRGELHGRLEAGRTLAAVLRMLFAAGALCAVAYAVWWGLDDTFGRSLPAQIVAVGLAAVTGLWTYAVIVLALRVPEAERIAGIVLDRLGR